jgi:hypothetical protein
MIQRTSHKKEVQQAPQIGCILRAFLGIVPHPFCPRGAFLPDADVAPIRWGIGLFLYQTFDAIDGCVFLLFGGDRDGMRQC